VSLEGTAGSGRRAWSTTLLLRLLAALALGGATACDGSSGGGGGGAATLPPRPLPPPPTVLDSPIAFSSVSSLDQDGTTGGAGGAAVIARSVAGLAGLASGADPVLAALADVTAEQLARGGGTSSGGLPAVTASQPEPALLVRSQDASAPQSRAELGARASVERASPPPPAPFVDRPLGFASVDALGQAGTTGGGAGPLVIARSLEELAQLISESGPLIVMIDSAIALDGRMLDVASDKTIIGLGSSAALRGGGLHIGLHNRNATFPPNAVRNVIVRNISFSDCPDDCINIQEFSHHIWIDHNEFRRPFDGAVDIVRGADFVEVSWNVFAEANITILLGASEDDIDQDLGRLRVSFHHNWFNGTVQRHPRVRFGEPVHVFNNYYRNVAGYGVASQENAGVLVEGNYFENTRRPTRNDVAGAPGRLVQRQNVFFASDAPFAVGTVVEPSTFYSYTLDDPNDVPFLVMSGAGVGRVVF
jgi:pectate lyase